MPAPAAQTPGAWLRAGGAAFSDADCRKALAACGLDPDAFGSYSKVLDSQSQERKKLRDQARAEAAKKGETPNASHHVPPCDLAPGAASNSNCRCHEGPTAQDICKNDPARFLHANAQSGHMGQDALFRKAGGRDDPCQNLPPSGDNSGTYGYETSKARCMEHYGRSNLAGSPHEQICRAEEDFQADMAARGKGPLTTEDMREGVGRSAVVAATAGRYRVTDAGGLQAASLDPAAVNEQVKYQTVQGDAAVASGAANPSGANMSKDMPGLTEAEATAVKCIQADWEASLAKMQLDSMQKNTLGGAAGRQKAVDAYNADPKNQPKVSSFDDIPKDKKDAILGARQKQLEDKMGGSPPDAQQSANDARSKERKKAKDDGRDPNPEAWDGKPTKAECREYQANWLALKTNSGSTKMPDMQGENPLAPAPRSTEHTDGDSGNSTF